MQKMKAMVCDDDIFISEWFRLVVEEYARDRRVAVELETLTDVAAMVRAIEEGHRPDIIFLDIMFPESNGIELAKTIRSKIMDCRLVLITSYDAFALDGYAVHAYDFLLKPLDRQAVIDLLDGLSKQNNVRLAIRFKGAQIELNSNDLRYAESNKHNVIFHMQNKQWTANGRLDTFEEALKRDASFVRCHQSYLVNMRFVADVKGRFFMLRDGTEIPIRKSEAAEIKKRYFDFLLKAAQ